MFEGARTSPSAVSQAMHVLKMPACPFIGAISSKMGFFMERDA
jgi:hypothetical protein